jgi:hypothetical protein
MKSTCRLQAAVGGCRRSLSGRPSQRASRCITLYCAIIAYLADGFEIHVVFTDIQLAGQLTGWDVAERFRAIHPEAAVIYASGNSVDRSRRVVGSMFFDKPYLPAHVVEACRRLSGAD